jgi:glycosyltransferase involved in cell wall biosynthesis
MLVSKELGGAGLIGLYLAAALRERVRKSLVWIPGEGPASVKAIELEIPWRQYDPFPALLASRMLGVMCNLTIAQLLRPFRPGLVHMHSPSYFRALLLGIKIAHLKSVVHLHFEHGKDELRWALKSPPDVIITCARYLCDYVRSVLPERVQNSQRIVAIPNAVDTERFHRRDKIAAKLQVGAPLQTPLILMVANLARHKGQETALQAAAILRKKGVAAHFWFAGVERDGTTEYTCRLRSLATALHLTNHVQFLGQRQDIPELLGAADFFILPSTAEGLPLSILEAQASKVPVLAAPTAGIPEIITHEKTGFLIAANDAVGYAAGIKCLLENPRLYASIADESYLRVLKENTWKTYVNQMDEIYASLLHK